MSGSPLGEWTTSIPLRPCKGLIIMGGGMGLLFDRGSPYPKLFDLLRGLFFSD